MLLSFIVSRLKVNPKFYRPTEVEQLLGDPTKAKSKLGWAPKVGTHFIMTRRNVNWRLHNFVVIDSWMGCYCLVFLNFTMDKLVLKILMGHFFRIFLYLKKMNWKVFGTSLWLKPRKISDCHNSNVSVCPKIQLFTRFRKIILCCFSMNFLCERTKLKMLGKYKVENILSSAHKKKVISRKRHGVMLIFGKSLSL